MARQFRSGSIPRQEFDFVQLCPGSGEGASTRREPLRGDGSATGSSADPAACAGKAWPVKVTEERRGVAA